MSRNWRVYNQEGLHFISFATVGWVDVFTRREYKDILVESLKQNEIDFAIVSVIPDEIEVNEEILIENKLFLVGNHDNFNKKMPLIYREKGSATRTAMADYFKNKKNEQKRIELTSNEAVKQAVIAGIGHSILPAIGIKNELENGILKIITRKGLPIKTKWRLVWLKQKKLSPVAEAYLQFVRENKNSIHIECFDGYDNLA